jgi:hypothetical protein
MSAAGRPDGASHRGGSERMRRLLIACAALVVAAGAPASAVTVAIVGGAGLDAGFGCVSGGACSPVFTIDGAYAATGTITFSSLAAGSQTVDISILVSATSSFSGSSAGASQVTFSNVSYSVTGAAVMVSSLFGQAQVSLDGFTTGSASGTADTDVTSPSPFDQPAELTSLTCLIDPSDHTGSCGFSFGQQGFTIDVNGTDHDFQHTFNVLVPEPATLGLVALGLVGSLRLYTRRAA